jgi:hypothetical protein
VVLCLRLSRVGGLRAWGALWQRPATPWKRLDAAIWGLRATLVPPESRHRASGPLKGDEGAYGMGRASHGCTTAPPPVALPRRRNALTLRFRAERLPWQP